MTAKTKTPNAYIFLKHNAKHTRYAVTVALNNGWPNQGAKRFKEAATARIYVCLLEQALDAVGFNVTVTDFTKEG